MTGRQSRVLLDKWWDTYLVTLDSQLILVLDLDLKYLNLGRR